MSEQRFNRLEEKVDRVDDKVEEVKIDVTEMKTNMKHHMRTVEAHVTSDNRIIKHIEPMLPLISELKEIVAENKFERMKEEELKEKRKLRMHKLKIISLKWGFFFGACGVILGLLRLF